jgi:hypothetical protein
LGEITTGWGTLCIQGLMIIGSDHSSSNDSCQDSRRISLQEQIYFLVLDSGLHLDQVGFELLGYRPKQFVFCFQMLA